MDLLLFHLYCNDNCGVGSHKITQRKYLTLQYNYIIPANYLE